MGREGNGDENIELCLTLNLGLFTVASLQYLETVGTRFQDHKLPLRWRKLIDWAGRWLLPPTSLAVVISGAFLTYNWDEASNKNPGLSTLYQFFEDWIGVVFFSVAIFAFALSALQTALRPSVRLLEEQVSLVGESFRTFCDGIMVDLSNKLGVLPGEKTRTSLYIHDGSDSFVLCGRHAPDPVLKRPGRPSYPEHQGCIGQAWQNEWHFENDLGGGRTYEQRTAQRYQIDPDTLNQIPMRSALFGVQRIDVGPDFIGLIVVESMRGDRFQDQTLRQEMVQFCKDYGAIIKAFKDYIPTPSQARARGF